MGECVCESALKVIATTGSVPLVACRRVWSPQEGGLDLGGGGSTYMLPKGLIWERVAPPHTGDTVTVWA